MTSETWNKLGWWFVAFFFGVTLMVWWEITHP